MDNAYGTLNEIRTHIENGFYNTAVNRMYYACYLFDNDLAVCEEYFPKTEDFVEAIGQLVSDWANDQM